MVNTPNRTQQADKRSGCTDRGQSGHTVVELAHGLGQTVTDVNDQVFVQRQFVNQRFARRLTVILVCAQRFICNTAHRCFYRFGFLYSISQRKRIQHQFFYLCIAFFRFAVFDAANHNDAPSHHTHQQHQDKYTNQYHIT